MGTLSVVGVDEGEHGLASFGGGAIGVGVGPFAQAGLDEALGLAVGAGRVGAGPDVAQAGGGDGFAEAVASIGRAIVGHDPLDGDAMGGEEGQRPAQKGTGALLFLVGEKFRVGEPGGIVDGDMERFPAGSALAALAAPVAGDAMADAVDAAELLGIEVDQLSWARPFVADRGRLWLEGGELSEAEPAQHGSDGRTRQAEGVGDLRPAQAAPAQLLDCRDARGRKPVRASGGRRAPVVKLRSPPAR